MAKEKPCESSAGALNIGLWLWEVAGAQHVNICLEKNDEILTSSTR